MFKSTVRKLTQWAWQKELDVTNSIVKINEVHATNGEMKIGFDIDPKVQQYIAQVFASMVMESPNYTEVKFSINAKIKSKYEYITVLVQKGSGKTPHELRIQAEKELEHYQKLYQEYVSKSFKEQ
jgi:hypothetical protein